MDKTDWQHEFADVTGISLHYVRQGHGRPLVLLHGWPEFWYTWHKIIPGLSTAFDVIAPDLRGFGQSEKPAAPADKAYTLDCHLTDFVCLLDALGLEKVGIVSHDIGATIAHSFARQFPDRVDGLFFFNIPYAGIGARQIAPENFNEIWYQGFHQQKWAAELIGSRRETVRIYLKNLLAHWAQDPNVFDDDLEVWVDNFLQPGNLQGGFNWYAAFHPLRLAMMKGEAPPVPSIDTPTCVRWGADEPFLKVEYADKLDEYFSNLDFKPVPNAGHFVHYQRPSYSEQEIKHFFGSL
ncbi:alpha/beta hydrolase (plasmid) [Phaeobacter sp. S60]|nr:alpha/beta hydrolase [Phaeobacter sp. S60]